MKHSRYNPFLDAQEEELKLDARRFEGLLVRSCLLKRGSLKLCFTVEHHTERSLGGYEVLVNDERKAVFKTLKDAVEYINLFWGET